MKKKAIFFDIDGTLYDSKAGIIESTKTAVRTLKEKGHLVFLCTGRSRVLVQEQELLNLKFDGIIAGCGTYVEYQNEILHNKEVEASIVQKTLKLLFEENIPVVLEGKDGLYLEEHLFPKGDDTVFWLKKKLGDQLKPISGNEDDIHINKMSVLLTKETFLDFIRPLKDDYEFIVHEYKVVELLPKGYGKEIGIKRICERLNIKKEDTYAFGDSSNDLSMFQYVGCAVAMGNGSLEIKEAADYVTDKILEDGIYNGLNYLGLI